MFVSGMNPCSLAFSFPTLVITIPSTIIVLIWWRLYGIKVAINRLRYSRWASFRCSKRA